jgi:hypothetical protein
LSLSLETRRAEREKWIRTVEELADRRRGLLATAAYEIETVDLASTIEAKHAHDERLRALIGDAWPRPLVRLDGGNFVVETNRGHLRRLRWKSFNPARSTGMAGELADAFNAGAGTELVRDDITGVLAELLLLERPSDPAVRGVFERHMPEGTSAETMQAGIDAMLARILEFDPDLRAERWTFDIPLREAVRTAAAWAAQENTGHAPVAQAP